MNEQYSNATIHHKEIRLVISSPVRHEAADLLHPLTLNMQPNKNVGLKQWAPNFDRGRFLKFRVCSCSTLPAPARVCGHGSARSRY